ncbi:dimethylargininase [Streptomyces chrestomyceticus]|uniref:dimethylargininase n=1 Tax=Streptomyces chrestomyceticus TaxID=68185 RepID=UPI0019D12CF3|nr:dimethylargininase [Streptomyces chrestomyceticus]
MSRHATPRRYLMCRPTYFEVTEARTPWMNPDDPVDTDAACRQWEHLRDRLRAFGHTVEELTPLPGAPEMVFAANGATVIDGRALGARFAHPERVPEAAAHRAWLVAHGIAAYREPEHANEGEGDYAPTASCLLAGHGFRTTPASHAEARHFFGRPVLALELVDPRYYHLDTALAVLDPATDAIMYHPEAFSTASRAVLRQRFPDAVLADSAHAAALGLNAVSDGRHVLLPEAARDLFPALRTRGFEPVGIDLSELAKSGGGAKCCVQELRGLGAP